MATKNKQVAVYLPPEIEVKVIEFCEVNDITRKDKAGDKFPALGTGIVEILSLFFNLDTIPSKVHSTVPSQSLDTTEVESIIKKFLESNLPSNLPDKVLSESEIDQRIDQKIGIALSTLESNLLSETKAMIDSEISNIPSNLPSNIPSNLPNEVLSESEEVAIAPDDDLKEGSEIESLSEVISDPDKWVIKGVSDQGAIGFYQQNRMFKPLLANGILSFNSKEEAIAKMDNLRTNKFSFNREVISFKEAIALLGGNDED